MPYREVIRAGKLGGRLAGHARTNARRVAASATAPFRDRLSPEREFLDLYQYQVAVGEELDRMRAELVAIDDRHAREQERDRQLRDQRDAWVAEMRPALVNLKDTLEGSYGPGTSRKVFQEDPPRLPDDPVGVYRVAKRIFDTLIDPAFELRPAQPGVAINPRVLAESFERPLRGLGEVLERLHDSENETRHTQSQKDELLERIEVYSARVGRLYEALFEIAGYDRLAKRGHDFSPNRSETARNLPALPPAAAALPCARPVKSLEEPR